MVIFYCFCKNINCFLINFTTKKNKTNKISEHNYKIIINLMEWLLINFDYLLKDK